MNHSWVTVFARISIELVLYLLSEQDFSPISIGHTADKTMKTYANQGTRRYFANTLYFSLFQLLFTQVINQKKILSDSSENNKMMPRQSRLTYYIGSVTSR